MPLLILLMILIQTHNSTLPVNNDANGVHIAAKILGCLELGMSAW